MREMRVTVGLNENALLAWLRKKCCMCVCVCVCVYVYVYLHLIYPCDLIK